MLPVLLLIRVVAVDYIESHKLVLTTMYPFPNKFSIGGGENEHYRSRCACVGWHSISKLESQAESSHADDSEDILEKVWCRCIRAMCRWGVLTQV